MSSPYICFDDPDRLWGSNPAKLSRTASKEVRIAKPDLDRPAGRLPAAAFASVRMAAKCTNWSKPCFGPVVSLSKKTNHNGPTVS